MGGEGSIQSMITILRNNKQLLRKRNTFRRGFGFGRLRDEYRSYAEGRIEQKPISEKDLALIRKKIIGQKRQEILGSRVILLFVVGIAIGLTIKFYNNLQEHQVEVNERAMVGKTKKYLFYIEDGDKWLENGRFHNAIFQYKLAREIYPGEYDVNYRLALAYGSKCRYEQSGCEEGRLILQDLKDRFPDRLELWKLESYF